MTLRLSATTRDKWVQCQRLWAFTFIAGERIDTSATDLGTKIHKILEDWLTSGKEPDLSELFLKPSKYEKNPDGSPVVYPLYPGQIARAGFHLLPPPGTSLGCEIPFRYRTQSVTWDGQIDNIHWDNKRRLPVVLDHKTSSDKKFAKTAEILATDSQAVLYPAALAASLGEDVVLGRWVYYLTKPGKYDAWAVEIETTPDQRAKVLDDMDRDGVAMLEAYERKAEPLSLPPNPGMCDQYGGCAYKSTCNLGIKDLIGAKSMQGETLEQMIARRKAEAAGGGTTAPAVPQAPAPALPAIPAPPTIPGPPVGFWQPGAPLNVAQDYLRSLGKSIAIIASAADNPPPSAVWEALGAPGGPWSGPLLGDWPALPAVDTGTINPPEAPKALVPSPEAMPAVPQAPAPAPAPVPQVPAAPQAPQAPADEWAGMDRDSLKAVAVLNGLVERDSKLREDSLRQLVRMAASRPGFIREGSPPPKAEAQPPKAEAVTSAPGEKFLNLYVGCLPVNDPCRNLSDLLSPVLEQMAAQTKLPHWGLEDFGKGGARLAAALDAYLAGSYDGNPNIYVDPRSAEASHCMPILLRWATQVVRATF